MSHAAPEFELPPELERRLPAVLLALRVTLGLFFLVWAVDKVVHPKGAADIWASFYGIQIPAAASPVLGLAEAALAVALLVGLWRRLTYGLAFLLHAGSVASTWEYLISPLGSPNHLFVAGVPVLAALAALYALRRWDVLWSADARRTAAAESAASPETG